LEKGLLVGVEDVRAEVVTHPRCPNTLEDMAIIHRNILRMKRWLGASDLSVEEKMRVLHRWTGDYLIR
jgi:hypothetical protein